MKLAEVKGSIKLIGVRLVDMLDLMQRFQAEGYDVHLDSENGETLIKFWKRKVA